MLVGVAFFATCVAATMRLEGDLLKWAVGVAIINAVTLVLESDESRKREPAGFLTAVHLFSSLAGAGLLLYSFVA